MYLVEKTPQFDKWFRKLRDRKAKAKILIRVQRLGDHGNFGDCQPVGNGISELRVHYGKSYRVYLKKHGKQLILLLIGGEKSTQSQGHRNSKTTLARIYK